MKLWTHPINQNDIRQCLRIAGGASIGFTVSKIFGWNFGVFFTVLPMLLLGLVPVMSAHAARQLVASGIVCALEVGILAGALASHPVLMTIAAFLLFAYKFHCMAKGPLFLFGATGVISLSIMLHFQSYPSTGLNELVFGNLLAGVLSVVIAYLMGYALPDVETRIAPPIPAVKQPSQIRHEMLLGATVATLSFIVFQVLNLSDSMSAQATTVLLLFPMNWNGALNYARKRTMGTILGVSFGLAVQLLLWGWSDILLLVVPLLWIGAMFFSYMHVKESMGSGTGFGGLTTIGILFGQYLAPNNDLVFSAMYRMSSVLVAIVATLMVVYVIHRILNQFSATRFKVN
ncbi:DUF2955 domain-containing protein (plasmid) [Pseudoalteromonas xiamenensis]|uniref:DUF2955 domain-containing protein n=1 Tax=Pseudoalteromonas xiamenensis TaxID=882626 RepID=UPI0027E3E2A1|nr:DUF2955 domain-containing protein [Pseudoalteromonas xiamenensis]WMN61643.1 DUF2955 domain-containing protein [Pseudoalteromonas xiamenensis]